METPPQSATKDGLSKKQRRALKVQQKKENHPNINAPAPVAAPTNARPQTDAQKKVEPAQTKPKPKETTKISETKKTPSVNTPSETSNKASEEKEKRRKEWESKLAQQKQTATDEKDSKAQLRAKRRELQEAQRQAKLSEKPEPKPTETPPKTTETKKPVAKKAPTVSKVQLVHHLYAEDAIKYDYEKYTVNIKGVHPAFMTLGAQHAFNTVLGSNARCLSLLSALKSLIEDLTTPPKQEFCRHLESTLQLCAGYLQRCRPFAVSMTNALRHFKLHLRQVDTNVSDSVKKARLLDAIDTYVQDEIEKADEAISLKVTEKIHKDVILIYGCSSLIRKILLDAHANKKSFDVIVVDGRPLLEGREMLRRLVDAGINCKYVLINAVSNVMSQATKVLLGAHALLANGYVMSRMGTAQVALIARAFNKPVLVCCETYKFSEKVQLDSFVYNEIGNPDKLLVIDTVEETSPLVNWKNHSNLTPLNLLYDVTPPDLVTGVVTELGFLPCTSVPVILRIRPNEMS